jgi:hypothetical protein
MNGTLRAAAAMLALIAIAEPSCSVTRNAPLAVEIRTADPAFEKLAADVRDRLRDSTDMGLDSAQEPGAIVAVGDTATMGEIPASVPVSAVMHPEGPNVTVRDVATTPVLIAGWTAPVRATVEAIGMGGMRSIVALEHQGVRLAQVEHRWTRNSETFEARFDYVPSRAGTSTLRVAAETADREIAHHDNYADVQLAVEDRKLRVLFFEPRPSWVITFVRRAIERASLFEVETLARTSRGIAARTGGAPQALSGRALEPFDAVVVGSPEELGQVDVDALDQFSRVRGGTVVLMPDRRPSGAYAKVLPARGFEEVLIEKPVMLEATIPPVKCSEAVVLTEPAAGVEVVAALPREKGPAPAIVTWRNGSGRVVFSGCLDGWRYRAEGDAFGRYWTSRIAEAAAGAPRRIEVSVRPAPARPGEMVRVTARLRHTEFPQNQASVELPSTSGRVTRPAGTVLPLRLWPTAETGVFEAHFRSAEPGRHIVEVTAGAHTAATALIVAGGGRTGGYSVRESLRALAAATGGVAVTSDDLSGLARRLDEVARPVVASTVRPSRAPLWTLAFAGLLATEWWLRRRRGHV